MAMHAAGEANQSSSPFYPSDALATVANGSVLAAAAYAVRHPDLFMELIQTLALLGQVISISGFLQTEDVLVADCAITPAALRESCSTAAQHSASVRREQSSGAGCCGGLRGPSMALASGLSVSHHRDCPCGSHAAVRWLSKLFSSRNTGVGSAHIRSVPASRDVGRLRSVV